ncbi:MAG: LacI family transcriptional regulator [Limnochordia bacterium]|jgi:LacI family transcriptional regulator|nr:LacI family transcriptional regulator [Limnochordia bacterium]
MTTIKDIAKIAGVSPATVSRALGGYGYVKDSTRRRIQEVADQLGYHPNALARSMVTRSTQTIGLIISDIANPFFPEVVRGIEDTAHQKGFTVILCNSDEDSEKERTYIDVLMAKRVDGLIIASTAANAQHLLQLKERNLPLVLLDRSFGEGNVDTVKVDNTLGAFQAVNHLIELGHRRIGIITGPDRIPTARERLAGYEHALKQHSIHLEPRFIVKGDFKEEDAYMGVKYLMDLERPPTALFTANNRTTTGALTAIWELGLHIPDELSVIAFDDLPWMQLLQPQLSVIQQPTYELGVTAAELLFKRLMSDTPQKSQLLQLNSKLVLRNSCGPPREQTP